MTIFNEPRGRVIDANSGSAFRLFGIALAAFVLVIVVFASVARVDSGHVGVLTLFGRVTGEVLPEGVHVINPFKANHELSIRTQEIKESASVPSSEGLVMNLDTSLIYHLNPEKAAEVYQKIGPNYMNVLVEPNLRAAIREATASHSANALYTGEREMVAKQIYDQLTDKLGAARSSGGERALARHPVADDVEILDRIEAAGRAGSAGDELPPAKGNAGGAAQAH